MAEGGVHQCLGGHAPVLGQQGLFQGPAVDADADGDVFAGAGLGHRLDPVRAADVARVDAHLVGPGGNAFQGQTIVKMDVHHQGQVNGFLDLPHGLGSSHGGHGHPNNLAPGGGQAADLGCGGLHIFCGGIGHGLDGDRGAAPYGHASHQDLFGHRQFTNFQMSLKVTATISRISRENPTP